MFRFLQASTLMAIALVAANKSEAKPHAPTNAPVHGTGSSHDPKGPTKNPVHGPGSSHDPKGPTKTHPRDYRDWSRRFWNTSYGCEYCWSGVYGCYFYFYAPAACYYPVSCIEQFPPTAASVRVAAPPVAVSPVVPVAPVAPVIQVTNVNQNTLVNR